MKQLFLKLLFCILIFTGLTACHEGGSSSSNQGQANVIFDTLDGGIANGAVNVSKTPSIVLKFSTPMNPSTINKETIKLSVDTVSSNANKIDFNIVSNQDNTVYTFTVDSPLDEKTKYKLLVDGVKTKSGQVLKAEFSFTTGDFTVPTVSIVTPSNNATGVSKSPSIEVAFSEAVTGVNATNVTLHEGSATGTAVAIGTITKSTNSNNYTFSPSAILQENTIYYVVLGIGIKDAANNALTQTEFSFTTGDFTVLTVSIVTPSNNATGVSKSPSIEVAFSEAVTGVNATNVTLHEGSATGTAVAIGTITKSTNSNNYTFSPSAILQENTIYYVVLGIGIKDAANNALTQTEFSFTTGDFTVLTVSIVTPSNNATGVSKSPSIEVAFSEAVTGVNATNVTLHEGSATGTAVAIGTITKSTNSNNYTFSPSAILQENTIYYVVLGIGIKNAANNALTQTEFSFTTGDFTYFISYYPTIAHQAPGGTTTDCVPNNAGATPPVVGTCECIQDPLTNKIWTAVGPNNQVTTGSWNDWTGVLLNTYNNTSHCGLPAGGWTLPSALTPSLGFMNSSNPGGDWGSIATAAGMSGSFFAIGTWMNNNGFKDINTGYYYWSAASIFGNTYAWVVKMVNGDVNYIFKGYNYGGVLLVHP